ncbi:hypothetical protein ACFXI8_26920 [Streptomyces niveus]|uniref:hypothetical protein n=1 Tax=Streptomyces niveus TaxID=193462 RepID=UPI003681B6FA
MSETGETIECRASRLGRTWTVYVPKHGVYGHGGTLKAVGESTARGLELVGVTAEVVIIPVTPELERLRSADEVRTTALSEAIAALALRRTTKRDIALATGVPARQVKEILAEQAEESNRRLRRRTQADRHTAPAPHPEMFTDPRPPRRTSSRPAPWATSCAPWALSARRPERRAPFPQTGHAGHPRATAVVQVISHFDAPARY